MESRASYLAVAAFLLALILGGITFAVWSAKSSEDGAVVEHYIRFPVSVAGLGVGSPVLFGGIPIGHVTSIVIDPKDSSLTRVEVVVRADAPIRADSKAVIQSKSLIGGVVVEIRRGGHRSAKLGRGQEIIAARSSLERLITGLPKLFTRLDRLSGQIDLFLNAQNAAAVARILAYGDRLWSAFQQSSGKLDDLSADSQHAAGDAGEAWDEVSSLGVALQNDGRKLSQDADKAMQNMRRAKSSFETTKAALDRLLEENRHPYDDFASSGYPQFPTMLAELRMLSRRVSHLWAEIQQDPARFFLTDRQNGYVAPP
jgi:phospholipid/cholesterol/gamma-HCH transport system substrate-binding protein